MFPRILTVSVPTSILEALTNAIYSGRLQPGEPLPENKLAQQLGVSQAAVREALVQLDHNGLVVRRLRRGTNVKNLTRAEVAEHAEVRIPLESLACVKAAKQMSDSDFLQLEHLIEQMTDENFPQADANFHRLIWQRANNQTLYRTLDHLTSPLFAFVNLMRKASIQNLEKRITSHKVLAQVLREQNEKAIKKVIQEHVEAAYRRFIQSDYPDFRSLGQQVTDLPSTRHSL